MDVGVVVFGIGVVRSDDGMFGAGGIVIRGSLFSFGVFE